MSDQIARIKTHFLTYKKQTENEIQELENENNLLKQYILELEETQKKFESLKKNYFHYDILSNHKASVQPRVIIGLLGSIEKNIFLSNSQILPCFEDEQLSNYGKVKTIFNEKTEVELVFLVNFKKTFLTKNADVIIEFVNRSQTHNFNIPEKIAKLKKRFDGKDFCFIHYDLPIEIESTGAEKLFGANCYTSWVKDEEDNVLTEKYIEIIGKNKIIHYILPKYDEKRSSWLSQAILADLKNTFAKKGKGKIINIFELLAESS